MLTRGGSGPAGPPTPTGGRGIRKGEAGHWLPPGLGPALQRRLALALGTRSPDSARRVPSPPQGPHPPGDPHSQVPKWPLTARTAQMATYPGRFGEDDADDSGEKGRPSKVSPCQHIPLQQCHRAGGPTRGRHGGPGINMAPAHSPSSSPRPMSSEMWPGLRNEGHRVPSPSSPQQEASNADRGRGLPRLAGLQAEQVGATSSRATER